MSLNENTKNAILQLQKIYPEKRSALIPALHLAQKERGFLPKEIQNEVAQLFGLDPNEVHAVVTFYDMFFEKEVGKHLIHVCKNLSCMLRGCDEVTESLCEKLQVRPGEMSADGEFTIVLSECLAACDRAPAMIVDDTLVGPIGAGDLDSLIENAKKGAGHPSPVQIRENGHG